MKSFKSKVSLIVTLLALIQVPAFAGGGGHGQDSASEGGGGIGLFLDHNEHGGREMRSTVDKSVENMRASLRCGPGQGSEGAGGVHGFVCLK